MYMPSTGRFDRLDPYAGNPNDPLSFHKYGFVHGDPIQGVDPSGLEFSLSGMVMTGGIIGASVGLVGGAAIGAYVGYQKDGTVLTWRLAVYPVVGALVGFGVGASIGYFIGTGIFGLSATGGSGGAASGIIKLFNKLGPQLERIIKFKPGQGDKSYYLIAWSFLSGVVSGVTSAVNTPNEYQEPISIGALSAYGTAFSAPTLYATWLGRWRVPGSVTIAQSFTLGFNLGYFGTVGLSELDDAIDSWFAQLEDSLEDAEAKDALELA